MQSRNSSLRYGNVAMAFHWTIALLLVTNLALGFYFANVMDDNDPTIATVIQIHKSIGLTVLVLSVLRLGWRLINPVPPLPREFTAGMRVLARGTHLLFYFFIVGVPLAGWATVSAASHSMPTSYFFLFPWPNLPIFDAVPLAARHGYHELLGEVHAVLAYAAGALAVVHVSAALWHHFGRRDNVLRRMLPGTTVT